jgi:ELWxxDGT repeat protein
MPWFTNANGTLFFIAADPAYGAELWKSDGTEAGTYMIKDINPAGDSSPVYITCLNNSIFFQANDGTHGNELWTYFFSNDECQAAIDIELGQIYSGTNYGATLTKYSSCGLNDYADVWYSFQPKITGDYTIHLSSDEFDTTLALYNKSCSGPEIDCNDDDYDSTNSQISHHLLAGANYPIRVSGFDGGMGNFQLQVTAGTCTQYSQGDINGDCKVDLKDFAIMASNWMACNIAPASNCQ